MSEPLHGWFIVELMGHRRLAGYVTEPGGSDDPEEDGSEQEEF